MPETLPPRTPEEVSAIREAMRQLEDGLRLAERRLPPGLDRYAREALLNLAVCRVHESEGPPRTAAILMRLGVVILDGYRLDDDAGIALTRSHR